MPLREKPPSSVADLHTPTCDHGDWTFAGADKPLFIESARAVLASSLQKRLV
jgi:hypothetical protein